MLSMTMTNQQLVLMLQRAALKYLEYEDKVLMYIYKFSKDSEYKCYQAYYGKENFMHLAGIKSKTMSAKGFYHACLEGVVRREDCSPCHSVRNMFSKITIMERLLDIRNCKLYRIGEKDFITQENDFEVAIGNQTGIIGYDTREKGKYAIPTTLLEGPISAYSRRPEKIMFGLWKKTGEEKYHNLFYEIKKDLFLKERKQFPTYIQNKIGELEKPPAT